MCSISLTLKQIFLYLHLHNLWDKILLCEVPQNTPGHKVCIIILDGRDELVRQKNSKAPEQKREMRPLASKSSRNFQGLEINFTTVDTIPS